MVDSESDTTPRERALIETWSLIHRTAGKRQSVIRTVKLAAFVAARERFTVSEVADYLGVCHGSALYMLKTASRLVPLRQEGRDWINCLWELENNK